MEDRYEMRETTENSDSQICTHYILQEKLNYFYSFSLNYKCVWSMEQLPKINFLVIPIVVYHVSKYTFQDARGIKFNCMQIKPTGLYKKMQKKQEVT